MTTTWEHDRAAGLTVAAPSLGRFLTAGRLPAPRATVIKIAVRVRDETTQRALDGLAVALAEPAPRRAAARPQLSREVQIVDADNKRHVLTLCAWLRRPDEGRNPGIGRWNGASLDPEGRGNKT